MYTQNINKTIKSSYSKTKYIVIAGSALILLAYGSFFNNQPLNKPLSASIGQEQAAGTVSSSLSSLDVYRGLPVSKVTQHFVPDSSGTAILLPQYHKNPDSQVQDSINDSAQINQEQSYQIVKHLAESFKVKLFVVEGQLAGPVPLSAVAPLKEKLNARNRFLTAYRKLNEELKKDSIDPELETELKMQVDKELAETNREIILKGAPLALKAEGADIDLFGSENQSTLQESAALVRDYVYVQDRLNSLEALAANNNYRLNRFLDGNYYDNSLLQSLAIILGGTANSASRKFDALESEANRQGKNKLTEQIELCRSLFIEMTGRDNSAIATNLDGSSPSRADNPYNNTRNAAALRQLSAELEKKIEKTVVEKRNLEAAKNFDSALKESGQQVGVIQFGAGHEQGLVKELNKLGLNVIVVTTQEVASRNSDLN